MAPRKQIRPPYRNYEANQQKILDAYNSLAADGVVLPSYEEIAKRAEVSLSTVKRHFANLNFDFVCKRERIYTPEVVAKIRDSALDGKSRAQKLYCQIMEGYIEKKDRKTEIVGDMNVNANVSGELKVNIQRGIIRSRADLEALQGVAKVIKKQRRPEIGQESGSQDDESDDSLLVKDAPAIINEVENLIIFK